MNIPRGCAVRSGGLFLLVELGGGLSAALRGADALELRLALGVHAGKVSVQFADGVDHGTGQDAALVALPCLVLLHGFEGRRHLFARACAFHLVDDGGRIAPLAHDLGRMIARQALFLRPRPLRQPLLQHEAAHPVVLRGSHHAHALHGQERKHHLRRVRDGVHDLLHGVVEARAAIAL